MLRIGLTGGIGSGKTTVAAIFEVLGIPVYYADNAAKKLMNDDQVVRSAIKNNFGSEAFINGKLNKQYLSDIVFANVEKLALLNSIVHPATIKDADEWMKQQTSHYIVKEAALIFESGSDKNLDYIIGVRSPEKLRIERAMKRDNISKDEVAARITKQMNEDEKINLCDFVILNDEQQMLLPQVLELHQKFLQLSA